MGSHSPKAKKPSICLPSHLFFLFLLLSTNLLTFFLSTTYNPCSFAHEKIETKTRIALSLDEPEEDLPLEFVTFAYGQKLPFGFNKRFDSDTMYSPVGRACSFYKKDLRKYMNYKVNGSCPNDESLAQKLLLKGCEPLPRRRCRPAAAPAADDPVPYPACQWTTPPDTSVVWNAYSCKNYTCLVNRRLAKGSDDCKDCFDLQGREPVRWREREGKHPLEFTIDEVVAMKKPGTIRIGLDIGGGAGTFAVRMREKNVTIVTTSMNFNAPFNNFIASRGVIPLYITISQRLPFFDNTLDIVHSMHVISNWIPTKLFQFLLYDIYRVLRPGGIFWLDHFFCRLDQWQDMYKPLIESIGFTTLKWIEGRKPDKPQIIEIYFSAVLEKPLNNSWY
ncbi:hypothetical protein Droror1_Dr00014560 [Drosera rotundifolia]